MGFGAEMGFSMLCSGLQGNTNPQSSFLPTASVESNAGGEKETVVILLFSQFVSILFGSISKYEA